MDSYHQEYNSFLLDQNYNELFNYSVELDEESSQQFFIDLSQININYNNIYTFKIEPENNPELYQEIEFYFSDIIIFFEIFALSFKLVDFKSVD